MAQHMLNSYENRQALRAALLKARATPWPAAGYIPSDNNIILGVLASDIRFGVRSLRDYCTALDISFVIPESRIPGSPSVPAITGPVYIKLNARSQLCYVTLHSGRDRGVLVTLGSEQLGHFPLGMHDEKMTTPPPSLAE